MKRVAITKVGFPFLDGLNLVCGKKDPAVTVDSLPYRAVMLNPSRREFTCLFHFGYKKVLSAHLQSSHSAQGKSLVIRSQIPFPR